MNPKKLPLRNISRKPLRTAGLVLLVVFLVTSMFGGSVIVHALRSGMDSLGSRLGADIIVVPDSAKSKTDLNSMLLQGTPGYFYMSSSYLDKLSGIEGIEKMSPQYFLASASAGCCTAAVQIIGFDPATDFTVQPWIRMSGGGEPGFLDVYIGSEINSYVGGTITLYGVDCSVAGKLDSTGTGLDTAVYATSDTVKRLIEASAERGMSVLTGQSPDSVVSSVYIKVKEGYDPEDVANDINLHIRRVEAVKTKTMLTGISDSLTAVSGVTALLIGAVWVMCLVIMLIAFSLSANERKKEFAVLRAAGMSRSMLAGVILSESFIISLIGSVTGIILTYIIVYPFASAIESSLSLPFLLPDTAHTVMYMLLALAVSALAAPAASAWAAVRLSRVDVGSILRDAG